MQVLNCIDTDDISYEELNDAAINYDKQHPFSMV